jgi:hypothetical protein
MIRLIFFEIIQIVILILMVFLMILGYQKESYELLIIGGLGFVLFIFGIIFFLKFFTRIQLFYDSVRIKNIITKNTKKINFDSIDQWESIYVANFRSSNLLIKINGKKTIISNMVDLENYKQLEKILNDKYLEKLKGK